RNRSLTLVEGEILVIRSHEAGVLRAADTGTTVKLAGWVARRRDHGGVIFVDLRDASGVVQVVFREDMDTAAAEAKAKLGRGSGDSAHGLRNEYCVLVTGTVQPRPRATKTPSCRPAPSRSSPRIWR